MPFDWRSLLEVAAALAQEAISQADGEPYYRSVVNRAYFGAFGFAMEYAVRHGFRPTNFADDHGRLRERFRRQGGRKRKVADALERLREARTDADYLSDLAVSENLNWEGGQSSIAASSIEDARRIFAILSSAG